MPPPNNVCLRVAVTRSTHLRSVKREKLFSCLVSQKLLLARIAVRKSHPGFGGHKKN